MSSEVIRVIFTGPDHDPTWIFDKSSSLPQIENGETLIKIRLATICGSDIHTVNGKRLTEPPIVLGHEAVGEIVLDKGTKKLAPCTRVTFSIASSCHKCHRCRIGYPQKCEKLKKIGHSSLKNDKGFQGCYATHIILAKGSHVVPVPKKLTDRMVAPINCALATMVNAVEQARTGVQDKSALILGAGLLGIYGCALLKESGYEQVYCCDVVAHRLKFAEQFGAKPLQAIRLAENDSTVGEVDTVIEVCGHADVIQDGYRRLRHGGTLVLVGLVHPDSHLGLTGEQIISKCITIRGVHNYAPRHLDKALDFLCKTCDKYPYEDLVSPMPFPLEHIERAINETEKRLYHRSCLKP